jgi:hypothetical protein
MNLNPSSLTVHPPAPVLRLRDAFGAEWPNITASRGCPLREFTIRYGVF